MKADGESGEDEQDRNGEAIGIRSGNVIGVELVGHVCKGCDGEQKAEQCEERAGEVSGENSQRKQRDDEDTGDEDEEKEQAGQGREKGEAGAAEFDALRDGERKVEKNKKEEELGGEMRCARVLSSFPVCDDFSASQVSRAPGSTVFAISLFASKPGG